MAEANVDAFFFFRILELFIQRCPVLAWLNSESDLVAAVHRTFDEKHKGVAFAEVEISFPIVDVSLGKGGRVGEVAPLDGRVA